MKRLIVYFSITGGMEKREQFVKQFTNPNLSVFPDSLQSDLLVILLGNVESKINGEVLLSRFRRNGNLVVLVPNSIRVHIAEICNKEKSLLRNHTSSITLIKDIVAELKRLLVADGIATVPEQITFDEVIDFDFITQIEITPPDPGSEEIIGISLKTLIEKNPNGIPLEDAKPYLEAIQKTLVQAHKQGQMRLEFLRPANIFYDSDKKTATLVDWQIPLPSKEKESYKSCETLLAERHPDNADFAPAVSDDVYSLACITYKLLSGNHPFAGKTADVAENQDVRPEPINSLNSPQREALTKGLAFKRLERTQTINEFLEPFLKKTFYDFIQKMVEAPFFVGFVIGGGLLIFTIFYLYFGVQVSSLESRIQFSRKDAEVASSQNIGELQTQLAESRKQSAELQTQFDESRKQSAELQTQLDKSQKQSEESQTQLNNLLVSSIDTAEYALSKMGAVKCVSPPTNLVFSSTKRLVDNDWPKQKDNLLWIENRLERLIDVCQREKSKDKEAKQREKELADYKQKIHKLNLTPQ